MRTPEGFQLFEGSDNIVPWLAGVGRTDGVMRVKKYRTDHGGDIPALIDASMKRLGAVPISEDLHKEDVFR